MSRRLRVLHAIHDFLPRHRAGSEIYAFDLALEQSSRHDVFVLAAEYDPGAAHGSLRWRACGGLTVIEMVNNWEFAGLVDSYRSARLNTQLGHAIDAVKPDVLHVHNLLNLSFDLPALARARGASVAATLHDYTLACASGGQRVHVAESHVCTEIDPVRCRRCFVESPFHAQMAAGRLTRLRGGSLIGRAALRLRRLAPAAATAAARAVEGPPVSSADIEARLAAAREVFRSIDVAVAPSPSLGAEFVRLGFDPARLEVADYGFPPLSGPCRPGALHQRAKAGNDPARPLRVAFVGTLVWHKGAHVLLEAARLLPHVPLEIRLHGDTEVFPAYVAGLRRTAEGLPVTFHGGFERSQAGAVYAGADVLVVPSLWPENSPLVIHEAFMAKVPVVAARTGGIADLIRHEVDGLLTEPGSPAALAAALERLAAEPVLRARLAAAAPAVRTIAEDAAEWDARYVRLREARLPAVS